MSRSVVTHWNAGVTVVGSVAGFNLGASAVYRLRRSVNLLLEALWLDPDGFYLNPGIRWAHNLAGGLQVVPGLAYTVAFGPQADRDRFSSISASSTPSAAEPSVTKPRAGPG